MTINQVIIEKIRLLQTKQAEIEVQLELAKSEIDEEVLRVANLIATTRDTYWDRFRVIRDNTNIYMLGHRREVPVWATYQNNFRVEGDSIIAEFYDHLDGEDEEFSFLISDLFLFEEEIVERERELCEWTIDYRAKDVEESKQKAIIAAQASRKAEYEKLKAEFEGDN